MRKSVVRGWVLGLLLSLAWAGRGGAEPSARAVADAAKEVYEALETSFKTGMRAAAEELYLWSKRWYAAERAAAADDAARAAAAAEHLKRMQLLEQLAEARRKTGLALPVEVACARYYVRQAELWRTGKVSPP